MKDPSFEPPASANWPQEREEGNLCLKSIPKEVLPVGAGKGLLKLRALTIKVQLSHALTEEP